VGRVQGHDLEQAKEIQVGMNELGISLGARQLLAMLGSGTTVGQGGLEVSKRAQLQAVVGD
jgi:hypothetical protein